MTAHDSRPPQHTPRPGWYPDPAGPGRVRYYDGTSWTGHVRPTGAPANTAPGPRPAQPSAPPLTPLAPITAPPVVTVAPPPPTTTEQARTFAHRKLTVLIAGACALFIACGIWTAWGSGLYEQTAQGDLGQQLQQQSSISASPSPGPTVGQTTAPTVQPAPPASTRPTPSPSDSLEQAVNKVLGPSNASRAGSRALGRIRIPAIGVDLVFVDGTGADSLALGPGLWHPGVFPGDPGNATIGAHRWGHGGPFLHIDELKPGDLVYISAPGRPDAVFQIRGHRIVPPTQVSVTYQTPGVRLTLLSCDDHSLTRYIVQAEEISGANVAQAVPASKWRFQA